MATIVCLSMDRFMLNLTMDELERLGDDPIVGLQNLLNPPAPKKAAPKPKKKVSSEK